MCVGADESKRTKHNIMNKRIEIGIAGRGLDKHSFGCIERLATELSLRGACFTRPDGSIRVTAEGEESALAELARKIERGNMFGTVENFFIRWEPADNRGFRVLVGC